MGKGSSAGERTGSTSTKRDGDDDGNGGRGGVEVLCAVNSGTGMGRRHDVVIGKLWGTGGDRLAIEDTLLRCRQTNPQSDLVAREYLFGCFPHIHGCFPLPQSGYPALPGR